MDAKRKLQKFCSAPAEPTRDAGAATCTNPHADVPAKWMKKSAIPITATAAALPGVDETTKVQAAEQTMPETISHFRLFSGSAPRRTSMSTTNPLMSI